MKIIIVVLVLGSFFISPNLLYMLGVNYGGGVGGALEKIHPCSYLALIALIASVVLRKRNRVLYMPDAQLFRLICLVFILAIYCAAMGYVSSIPIVTFFTPLALLYLAERTDASFLRKLGYLIRVVLALNSALGIGELVTGVTLLERVAGDVLVENDSRSIGFIGHPLSSSLVSAMILVYLAREFSSRRPQLLEIFEFVMHLGGLVAFGGRVALVSTAFLVLVALVSRAGRQVGRSRKSLSLPVRVGLLVLVGVLFIAFLFSDFGENVLSRFGGEQNADKSSESRFSALLILASMDPVELILGVSDSRRVSLMGAFDTDFGIEVTWISWILSFGAVWAIVLGYILYRILASIVRGNSSLRFVSALFLIAITGAQGLGGKTMMLTWLVSLLMCFSDYPARSSRRGAKVGVPSAHFVK